MQEYPVSLRNATIGLRGCPFCGEPAYINLTPDIQVKNIGLGKAETPCGSTIRVGVGCPECEIEFSDIVITRKGQCSFKDLTAVIQTTIDMWNMRETFD